MNKLHSYYITDTTDLLLKLIEKHGHNNTTLINEVVSELDNHIAECEKIEEEVCCNDCHEWNKWWRDIRYLWDAHKIVEENWNRAERHWKER
jgi:hypothetical protein